MDKQTIINDRVYDKLDFLLYILKDHLENKHILSEGTIQELTDVISNSISLKQLREYLQQAVYYSKTTHKATDSTDVVRDRLIYSPLDKIPQWTILNKQ